MKVAVNEGIEGVCKLNCTMIDHLHILHEWAPNTPELFRAVFSSAPAKTNAFPLVSNS
jgi:hypothetical protein